MVNEYNNKNEANKISNELRKIFKFYQMPNIKSINHKQFTQYIHSKIGEIDSPSEGYSNDELVRQRDLSIKFHWGHNHDFGDFKIEGRMGDRHINVLANFITLFSLSLEAFKGRDIFDIGCWTGGTTMLLAALGGKVFGIEEVKKYAEMSSFLIKSFGIEDKAVVKPISVYNCNSQEYYDRFDIVHFPGVIYHLSDPILALRILFNSLKASGIILIESAGINQEQPFCEFEGSLIHNSGTKERMNRSGWNWFIPSPSALYRMMREAGFEEIKTLWHRGTNRIYGYGEKISQIGICRAGLSVPDIR